MNIHYLQHVPFEGLGYIEEWLQQHGHSIASTRFFEEDYRLPAMEDLDALIILGGPMSVYDEHQYHWLHEEKMFIEDCIRAGKKVLGICLGAQLMAVCLGANVYTATRKEIGWFPVMPTEEGRKVSWFYELFRNNPVVFHWHGEKFDIPYDGSLELVFSEANNNQAFYHSQHIIGLQFHLEVTEASITQMIAHGVAELVDGPYIQPAAAISKGSAYIRQCNDMMAVVLAHWLG